MVRSSHLAVLAAGEPPAVPVKSLSDRAKMKSDQKLTHYAVHYGRRRWPDYFNSGTMAQKSRDFACHAFTLSDKALFERLCM